MEAVIAGFVASSACLALLAKCNMRRWLGYSWFVDIMFTIGLALLFSGTYAGMSAAMLGGLLLSMKLLVLKRYMGAEKWSWRQKKWVAC